MRSRTLRALLLPPAADPEVVVVANSGRAISEVLGGILLDDITVILPEGGRVTFYMADESWLMRDNPAAATLAARLGLEDRATQARIRGPILIAGVDCTGQDSDIPTALLTAARQAGVLA